MLRPPGGEILNSTYFSVVGPADAQGGVRLEGRGYGHGIGMCQWGAIGRARVADRLSWEVSERNLLGFYERLLARTGATASVKSSAG